MPTTTTTTATSTPRGLSPFDPTRLRIPTIPLQPPVFPSSYDPITYPGQYTLPQTARQLTINEFLAMVKRPMKTQDLPLHTAF